MRNKNFDADLLKTLNEQPMPAAPLTDDEFARVLDAACAKLPQAKKTVKRRFPWGRVAAAAAACLAVGPVSYTHLDVYKRQLSSR